MLVAQLERLWDYLCDMWNQPIDPIAASLPLPQALILIELVRQLEPGDVHYSEILTAEALYETLSPYSRGEWYQFVADLEVLNQRMFISWNGEVDDRVLISPRGAHLARERMKKLIG